MVSMPGTILNEAKYQKIYKDRRKHHVVFHGIKANERIRVELVADLAVNNLRLKILGQPHDDVLLSTDRGYKHYKQMRIALSSRMDSYSGNTTEKLVASNTTKFSYRSSLLKKYSRISTENLVEILELTRRLLHTEKSIDTQIWLN